MNKTSGTVKQIYKQPDYTKINSEQLIKKELDELITDITENVLDSTIKKSFVKELHSIKQELKLVEEGHFEEIKRKLKHYMIFISTVLMGMFGMLIYLLFLLL